jgi:2-amino-4-hydroxy-6-hydroxymethyldihydropteridine diphosphokinase
MTRYAVGLGSNLGDRRNHLITALAELAELGTVAAVSGLYETEPVGGPGQPSFLNAVAVVESSLEPAELLAELHRIESGHGRVREERWGPRTLDLDLIATEGEPVSMSFVEVPHPRSGERRFVLEPLVEVWPDAMVSGGVSAAEALSGVLDQIVARVEEL